jgi:hypothetical protein
MNIKNCIRNLVRLELIMLSGIISRGKYTFPIIFALSLKTVEVLVKLSEK